MALCSPSRCHVRGDSSSHVGPPSHKRRIRLKSLTPIESPVLLVESTSNPFPICPSASRTWPPPPRRGISTNRRHRPQPRSDRKPACGSKVVGCPTGRPRPRHETRPPHPPPPPCMPVARAPARASRTRGPPPPPPPPHSATSWLAVAEARLSKPFHSHPSLSPPHHTLLPVCPAWPPSLHHPPPALCSCCRHSRHRRGARDPAELCITRLRCPLSPSSHPASHLHLPDHHRPFGLSLPPPPPLAVCQSEEAGGRSGRPVLGAPPSPHAVWPCVGASADRRCCCGCIFFPARHPLLLGRHGRVLPV